MVYLNDLNIQPDLYTGIPIKDFIPLVVPSGLATATSMGPTTDNTISEYIIQSNDFISSTRLLERLKFYEGSYGISSKEFFTKWINNNFEDSWETNEWADLYRQLGPILN